VPAADAQAEHRRSDPVTHVVSLRVEARSAGPRRPYDGTLPDPSPARVAWLTGLRDRDNGGCGGPRSVPPDRSVGHRTGMDFQAIVGVFVGAVLATFGCFWLHTRFAGTGEHVGPFSMAAFVLGWLCVITAVVTGMFLLVVVVSR